ncbi:MAG: SAF domain-containing protein [Clostridium celatum]|uniref:SAF domain-containing protein n=1 Tax=Clostridium tertium TaxID=1559 RepID=UPI002904DE9B|nr:SAF domain-containing protein [Clostridium celatum]
MLNDKKKIKIVIGGSLIIMSGITLFYQYRFSKVQESNKQYVIVAKKQININDKISSEDIMMIQRNKSDIVQGNIEDMNKVVGSVAKETIYENEDININRIISEDEYEKKDMRLVSIKVNVKTLQDALVGNEVKPRDKVDILCFDKQGVYEGTIYKVGQVIYDLKSSEGISYVDRGDGFTPAYALIWVDKKTSEEIYEKQESEHYFKFILHRESKENEENGKEKTMTESIKEVENKVIDKNSKEE